MSVDMDLIDVEVVVNEFYDGDDAPEGGAWFSSLQHFKVGGDAG